MTSTNTTATPTQAIGYARVSTEGQAESGAGMAAQRAAIEQACEARGWALLDIETDNGATGTNTDRPGLQRALDRIEPGQALVVAKLDRLSRSVQDAAALMDRARSEGWALVGLDLGVDTSTAAGRLVANVLAAVAQWESDAVSERTSAALQARIAAGAQLGRPDRVPDETVARIKRWRSRGQSLPWIANRLNETGTPTAQGGAKWHASTVRGVLIRTRGRKIGV